MRHLIGLLALAVACGGSEERPPTDGATTTPPPPEATAETGQTPPGETAETGETGGTGETGLPSVDDPFLAGDPTTLAGIVELAWYPEDNADEWAVLGLTFTPGSLAWSGVLEQAATGLESCEVRSGDPELTTAPLGVGALDATSAAGDVQTSTLAPGVYLGSEQLQDLDPRGVLFGVTAEGDALPGFALPDAVLFPPGRLSVSSPQDGQELTPGAPLPVTWDATDPAAHLELHVSAGDTRIRCLMDDDGAFEVPGSVTSHLPVDQALFGVYRVNHAGPVFDGAHWIEVRAVQAIEGRMAIEP